MNRQKLIHDSYNFSFGIMYNEYPKELHENLHVPGIFKRKSSVKVHLKDGRTLEMDASYVVDPDFKTIFEETVVNLEHQSTPVGTSKIEIISSYSIQQIHNEKLPSLSVIASHIDKKEHVDIIERTPSFITKLYFLRLDEDDNKKRLSKVTAKIRKQEEITINDALDLGIIALFAPRYRAKEITEEVISLYSEITDQIPQKMEMTLYFVLFALSDAYCDDKIEFERLINMLNSKTSTETKEKFESFDIFQNKIQELEQENNNAYETINNLQTENNNLQTEKNNLQTENNNAYKTINNLQTENNNAYKTINNLQTENNNLQTEKNNATEEINKLKIEINRLKKQLNAK